VNILSCVVYREDLAIGVIMLVVSAKRSVRVVNDRNDESTTVDMFGF